MNKNTLQLKTISYLCSAYIVSTRNHKTQKFINNKPDEGFRILSFAHATVYAASGVFKFYKNAYTEQQNRN